MTEEERNFVRRAALGRIFKLASRPAQEGDVEQHEAARAAFLATFDEIPTFYTLPHAAPRFHRVKHPSEAP